MLRKLISILTALFVVSIALLLVYFRSPAAGSIEMEAAKALLQLGVVAVAGTVISLLVFEYQRERNNNDKQQELDRKALEYRDELLRTTLSKTMAAYSQAKKARRLLRARAIEREGSTAAVHAAPYDECFDLINDSQLELENLARDVLTSEPAFSAPDGIVTNLRSMETHLSKLVGEYERCRGRFVGEKPILPLDQLPLLADFLLQTRESAFKPEVVIPFHKVQSAIRGDLLHPQLPARATTPNSSIERTA